MSRPSPSSFQTLNPLTLCPLISVLCPSDVFRVPSKPRTLRAGTVPRPACERVSWPCPHHRLAVIETPIQAHVLARGIGPADWRRGGAEGERQTACLSPHTRCGALTGRSPHTRCGALLGPSTCGLKNICTLFCMTRTRVFLAEPLAYFLTWTTYASWLPGDARGWSDRTGVMRQPNLRIECSAARLAAGRPISLAPPQRLLVASAIEDECRDQAWDLLAVSCRVQHVHVVVAAPGHAPEAVSKRLKAASARAIALATCERSRTWTRGCSRRWLWDDRSVDAAVRYVTECQDRPRP